MTDGHQSVASTVSPPDDPTLEYEREAEEPLVDAVVAAVGDATGTSVTDLQPLYSAVDPDALEALVESGGDVAIAFEYGSRRVVVDGERSVTVY
ncbi:HalOD1 output domain-containing protein [Halomicrobium salinisoli]|uniref:HalOD1 output domain-containing protein n=1 Tax=Halomicrobium salinisoli TaxID=2878391 RepID=UPI001CF0A986|nr:HalOD1 output domain-containing protein [Halomicrobium salinisoli]